MTPAERLAAHPSVRVLNDVVLNQVLVQFRAPGAGDEQAAAFTQQVIARVQEDGTCWAGGHHVARPGRDAHFDLQLVDDRRGRRPVRRGHHRRRRSRRRLTKADIANSG